MSRRHGTARVGALTVIVVLAMTIGYRATDQAAKSGFPPIPLPKGVQTVTPTGMMVSASGFPDPPPDGCSSSSTSLWEHGLVVDISFAPEAVAGLWSEGDVTGSMNRYGGALSNFASILRTLSYGGATLRLVTSTRFSTSLTSRMSRAHANTSSPSLRSQSCCRGCEPVIPRGWGRRPPQAASLAPRSRRPTGGSRTG